MHFYWELGGRGGSNLSSEERECWVLVNMKEEIVCTLILFVYMKGIIIEKRSLSALIFNMIRKMKELDQTCMCGPMYPFLCAVLSSTYCNLQKLWSSEIKRISRGGVPLKFCFTFEILYLCQTSDMNLARSIMDPVIKRQACNDI